MQRMRLSAGLSASFVAVLMSGTALAQDQITLRMSWWGGDSRHEATQAAIDLFEEAHPNITVEPEFTGFSGHQERIATQLAGRTEADVMQINWPWLVIFSAEGDGFADLSQFADIIDLGQWDPSALETTTVNGRLNGLPVSVTGRVFFMNATTYEQAGIALPTSYDALIAAAEAMKGTLGDDYYPFNATGYNAWLLVALYAAQKSGVGMIDPGTAELAWSAELIAEGLAFYQSLVDAGVLQSQEESAAEGNVELFERPDWAEGRLAGSYEWDSTYGKYADPLSGDQVLAPVPTLLVDGAVNDGVFRKPSMMFSISANTEHPEEAAMLLQFLLNDPVGVAALGTTRGIPASQAAADLLVADGLIGAELAAAHQIIVEASAPTPSPFFENPAVSEVYLDVTEEFAYGLISAEEAGEAIHDGVSAALRRLAR